MIRWLLTCEHGGNQVPEPWRERFAGAQDVLASHRGWDRGSLAVMEAMEPQVRLMVAARLSPTPSQQEVAEDLAQDEVAADVLAITEVAGGGAAGAGLHQLPDNPGGVGRRLHHDHLRRRLP